MLLWPLGITAHTLVTERFIPPLPKCDWNTYTLSVT